MQPLWETMETMATMASRISRNITWVCPHPSLLIHVPSLCPHFATLATAFVICIICGILGQVDQAAEKVEKKQGGATVEQKARIKWEGCQGVESLFGSHGFYVIFDMFF